MGLWYANMFILLRARLSASALRARPNSVNSMMPIGSFGFFRNSNGSIGSVTVSPIWKGDVKFPGIVVGVG